jgi:hypothetical protein
MKKKNRERKNREKVGKRFKPYCLGIATRLAQAASVISIDDEVSDEFF